METSELVKQKVRYLPQTQPNQTPKPNKQAVSCRQALSLKHVSWNWQRVGRAVSKLKMGPYKEKLGNLQKSGATSPVNEYLDMALADCRSLDAMLTDESFGRSLIEG